MSSQQPQHLHHSGGGGGSLQHNKHGSGHHGGGGAGGPPPGQSQQLHHHNHPPPPPPPQQQQSSSQSVVKYHHHHPGPPPPPPQQQHHPQQSHGHHQSHHHSIHGHENRGGNTGGPGGVNNNNYVIVELVRDDLNCPSFGFNIKGGAETGCPVYIWRVEPGSLADRSGLKSGDEIVQANGISFTGISHAEALKVLKGQTTLTLYIKAPTGGVPSSTTSSQPVTPAQSRRPPPPPPPLQQQQQQQPHPLQPMEVSGAIPLPPPPPPPLPPPHRSSSRQADAAHHRVEYYTWVDRHGNPVPPPSITTPGEDQYERGTERLINLDISPGQNLGLMIRGGSEYGLGIYVTGVDPGSVAERVGLERGDEILSVNGKNFTRITHDKAVEILKSSKRMQIVASYIGKIPADLNDGEDLLKLEGANVLLDDCDPSLPHHHHHHHLHHLVDNDVCVLERVGSVVPPPPPPPSSTTQDIEVDHEVEIARRLAADEDEILDEDEDVDIEVERLVKDHQHHHHHHHHTSSLRHHSIHGSVVPSHHHHHHHQQHHLHHLDDDDLDLDFVRGNALVATSVGSNVSSSGGVLSNSDVMTGGSTGTTPKQRCTTSILQMIEEKARTVLNKSEHSRFTFYRIEYMQGFLPVVAFVRILLELLNTHEKYTLLTEVRELIRPTDLSQFDELIYTKSSSFRVSSSSTTTMVPQPPQPPPPTGSPYSNPLNQQQQSQQQQQNQQQQPVPLPPPLPAPPPNFMGGHHHPQQLIQPDEIIMDDFIEHPLAGPPHLPPIIPPNINEINGQQHQQQHQQQSQQQQGQLPIDCCNPWEQQTGNPQNNGSPFNVGSNAADRQLLITHDPAALTMSHPQILNVMNNASSNNPTATTNTSVISQQPTTGSAQQQQPQTQQSSSSPRLANTPGLLTPSAHIQQALGVGKPLLGGTTPTNQLAIQQSSGTTNTSSTTTTTGANTSAVPAVRFKVRITKVKPILGIAIEGGVNTPHRLPRIIDVNPDGSAFHSNLRAGQVLLTVDGKKLDGLTHEDIARLILDCYVDMTKSQIEFLVVEAKQNYYYFNSQQNI